VNKLALAVLLFLPALAWAGTVPNPADYTINVHVSSARVRQNAVLTLKVVIDGKKYELESSNYPSSLLAPGDYKAKLVPVKVKDPHPYDIRKTYEFLFPDNTTRKYTLVGLSE